MTSLNTTTGWDANKLTGSNLTHGIIQGSGAVDGKEGYQHLPKEEEEKKKASRRSPDGAAHGRVVRATPATPVPGPVSSTQTTATTTSTTSSSLLTGSGGSGVLGPADPSSLSPLSEATDVMRQQRDQFYKEKYDYMTGVRIASTLGGFFLLVLLTLLYKSKCKGKHSREPSTLTLNSIPYPAPIHPAHLTLMRGQNIQVNGRHHNQQQQQHHHHHDFGGGGSPGGGMGGIALPPNITLLDNSSGYGCMNQVHPANSHQPLFSNCYNGTGRMETHMRSPAVLLITAANSESSDEELSELISGRDVVSGGGRGDPEEPPPPPVDRRRTRNVLGPAPPGRQVKIGDHLHPRCKSPPMMLVAGVVAGGDGAKGSIDINVILPTPSISPSGSENFNVASGGQYFGGCSLFPSSRGGCVAAGNRARLLVSRSLSSDNENDQSEMSGGGGGGELSECSSSSDAAAVAALAFGCANSSLFSLDNLKYVDDTSSENIPTRASDADDVDDREDTRSIGSDSVFACFDHNFDHIAPTYARRVSSVSGTSSGVFITGHSPYPGTSPLPRHHHCHHYSTIQPPPIPALPAAPPPPTQPVSLPVATTTTATTTVSSEAGGCGVGRTVSSSGFCEGTTEETSDFRVTLTQAHAQVHHRDSFCSDVESVNDYMETGARRRSSSTQTTLSDLRQALGYSPVMMGWSAPGRGGVEHNGGATSPGTISLTSTHHHSADISTRRLSVPRRRRSLSPHVSGGPPCPPHFALSPRNSTASTSPPHLSVSVHPAPRPPTSLPLPSRTSTISTANASTATTSTEGAPEDMSPQVPLTPATPTNPPPPTVVLSPSSPFIPSRVMRKRSFDAVRKTLSLQCEDKGGDMGNAYGSSSNETTPTN